MTITKVYTEPPICEKEILRYAGCKNSAQESLQFSVGDENLENLYRECCKEILPRLSYKVCYIELPLDISENTCDFGCIKVQSKDLVKNLQGCNRAIVFAATIGVEMDRLIAKYSRISPAKALLFQAIGTERIEALCDAFCEDVGCLHPRFSPGYGDAPLEIQRDILRILDASKRIGLSLNDSLLMSPSKSVTAFVGIGSSIERNEKIKCAACDKTDCAYRGV